MKDPLSLERHQWMIRYGRPLYEQVVDRVCARLGDRPLRRDDLRTLMASQLTPETGFFAYFEQRLTTRCMAAMQTRAAAHQPNAKTLLHGHYAELERFTDFQGLRDSEGLRGGEGILRQHTQDSMGFAIGSILNLAAQVIFQAEESRVLRWSDVPAMEAIIRNATFPELAGSMSQGAFGFISDFRSGLGSDIGRYNEGRMTSGWKPITRADDEGDWRQSLGLGATDPLVLIEGDGNDRAFTLNPIAKERLKQSLLESQTRPYDGGHGLRMMKSAGCPMQFDMKGISLLVANGLGQIEKALEISTGAAFTMT